MREAFSVPGMLVAGFVALLFLFKWINVLNEYERAVTFWLGRLGKRPKGPGLVLIFWPSADVPDVVTVRLLPSAATTTRPVVTTLPPFFSSNVSVCSFTFLYARVSLAGLPVTA